MVCWGRMVPCLVQQNLNEAGQSSRCSSSVRGNITIPRLELLAVHLGSTCLDFIARALPYPVQRRFIWSDSQCVLHWLRSDKPLTVFVRNRINEIQQHANIQFRYIPTNENPADIASRGCTAQNIRNCSLWWRGPEWLNSPDDSLWPRLLFGQNPSQSILGDIASEERIKTTTCQAVDIRPVGVTSIIDCTRYSSLVRLLRIKARCLHAFKQGNHQTHGMITADEMNHARIVWIKGIQNECYPDIINALHKNKAHPLITALALWIDNNGILRCGGRWQQSDLDEFSKHPILLPKNHHFTMLVIRHYHNRLFHAGVSQTLAQIRAKFWIPAGRSAVFKYIRACYHCRKYDSGPYKAPPMPALPSSRVTPSAPFASTGLDYLGPLFVKEKGEPQKVWICLFTCLVTRAIHLELVCDMTAQQFLLSLQRFIARRGKPSLIILDNAPQFKLAKSTMDKIWSSVIRDQNVHSYTSTQGINWRFIPERAPWMGGFYERLVRLVKQALRKTLGPLCLTFVQLQTLVTEIEAVINSRPLVHVGSDLKDNQVLTPSHFLTMNPQTGFPTADPDSIQDVDYIGKLSSKDNLLQLWKRGERYLANFWKHWHNDYLLSLRERAQHRLAQPLRSNAIQPQVGDIVQVHNDGPRGT